MKEAILNKFERLVKKEKPTVLSMLKDIEEEHPVLIAHQKEKQRPRKPAKVFNHLKPREAKEAGSQRKEIRLTLPIIDKLERKAKREGIDLKKYMEKVLIKAAAEKDFTTAL